MEWVFFLGSCLDSVGFRREIVPRRDYPVGSLARE